MLEFVRQRGERFGSPWTWKHAHSGYAQPAARMPRKVNATLVDRRVCGYFIALPQVA
jgi:hypothetical protein